MLMFLVNDRLVWRDKTVPRSLKLWCTRYMCILCFFAALNNLKSSFSEDKQPEHALDIFIENANKMVWFISLNTKKWRSNIKVAPKLCIFLYNAMETIGIRQGMNIMLSGVMGTVFNSCDA